MEGFGLVVLEAALCRLPVVAANLEGIRDAIQDGQNGYLVPSGDPAAFHQRISELLNNPKTARQFGLKSRRFTLKHYRWEPIADQYVAIYKTILQ